MESPVAPQNIEARNNFDVIESCAAYQATERASHQVIPGTRSSLPLKRETDLGEGCQYEEITSHIHVRNQINVMESAAAHLCSETAGVFPGGDTTVAPFKIDTDRGKESDSENVASHPDSGNVIDVTKRSALAAHHGTEASSNVVIPYDNNAAVPFGMDTHLGVERINYEKITSNVQVGNNIDVMESSTSAPYQNPEAASNGVISDGDIPAVPFSMNTDLGDLGEGRYFDEEIFECSYCDTFSSRCEDIEKHISEAHSDEIRAVRSDQGQDLNSSSVEGLPCGTNSSEEVANHTRSDLHIPECSAVEQSTEYAANQITVDDDSLTLPFNKDTDLGVKIKSGEDIFKCAHCDEVSKRREDIESHMSDEHLDKVGAFGSDRGLDLNSAPLESLRCRMSISEEVTSRTGDEIHMMRSSAADQGVQHATTQNQGFSGGNSSTFPSNKDTNLGVGSNSNEHVFKCAYCDVVSKQRNEIETHIYKEHFLNIDLWESRTLPTNNGTNLGTVSHSEEVTFKCAYCDTLSRSRKNIEIHISEKHSQDTRGARNNNDADVGGASNSAEVNYKCTYCDKVSNCREEIENHVSENHSGSHVSNNPNSSSLKCLSCGKVFSCQEDLTLHSSERYVLTFFLILVFGVMVF